MAWSVRLQDERGSPVVPHDAGIDFSTIPGEGDFKLLGYIDPYGDTVFNRLQMEDFLADWNKLRPAGLQQQECAVVQEMALRCRTEAHLYLRFIGD